MMVDLADEELNTASPIPDEAGDLRTEILEWANQVVTTLNQYPHGRSPFVAAVIKVVRDGGAPYELFHARIEALDQIFVRAAARGDHVALSATDLIEIILLPIYVSRLLSPDTVSPDLTRRLVDRFLTLNQVS